MANTNLPADQQPQQSEERFHIEKSANITVYKFKQQLIPAWRPIPSAGSNLILYTILTLLFVGLGVAQLIVNGDDVAYKQRYDLSCPTLNTTCTVSFTLPERIPGPVYFYYGLTNFYQSHHGFLKWKSSDQLYLGKQPSLKDAQSSCGIRTTNAQMGWTRSVTGAPLNPNDVAFPCGFMAYSFFNDTFSIDGVPISETGISWPDDSKQYNNWDLSKQGIDIKNNEHWLVWLRPSFTNDFYKLYGVINQDLNPGVYTLRVNNNYPLAFGQKKFQLNAADVFGGTNLILGIAYMVGAALSVLLFIDFLMQCIKQSQWWKMRREDVMHNPPNVQRVDIARNGYTFVPTAYS